MTFNSGNVASMASTVGSIVATQATASDQPAFDETARNGLPGLVVDGAWDCLRFDPSPLPAGDAPSTVVCVGFKTQGSTSGDIISWGNGSGSWRGLAADNMRAIINGASSEVPNGPVYWSGSDRIVIWSAESAVAHYWSIDGAAGSVSTVITFATGSTYGVIGGRANATNAFWAGAIQQIMVIGRLVTTDERQRLEGWLAHRWALTSKLTGEHPYKSAPPTMEAAHVVDIRDRFSRRGSGIWVPERLAA